MSAIDNESWEKRKYCAHTKPYCFYLNYSGDPT
jgi:hypothetical protein